MISQMPSDYYPGVCKDRLTVFISYAGLFQLESHVQFFFWPQHIFLSISSKFSMLLTMLEPPPKISIQNALRISSWFGGMYGLYESQTGEP